MTKPLIVALEMGYGHLRAAHALAEALGEPVWDAAQAPIAEKPEQASWDRARRIYEYISRTSQIPYIGRPFRGFLNTLTYIPELHPYRDLSSSNWVVNRLDRSLGRGLGDGVVRRIKKDCAPLLTTFYAPALAAEKAGCSNVFCVVTDTDIHRIWVPKSPKESSIHYFVPTPRTARRLISYGVSRDKITFTGFPLPPSLLGGPELPALRKNLASRLHRLDPEGIFFKQYKDELKYFFAQAMEVKTNQAPLLTFAVGGAGAQAGIVRDFLPALRGMIEEGRLRLTLVSGLRPELKASFESIIRENQLEKFLGRDVQILSADSYPNYYSAFNQLLAETDILWTKPSELTFYAALGIPMIFSWPVGHHEKCNRRWAIENGAGLKQGNPKYANHWIGDWLSDGTLAAAAWSGFMRMPKFGTYRIIEALNSLDLALTKS